MVKVQATSFGLVRGNVVDICVAPVDYDTCPVVIEAAGTAARWVNEVGGLWPECQQLSTEGCAPITCPRLEALRVPGEATLYAKCK